AFGEYDEEPRLSLEVIRHRWMTGAYRNDSRATWIIWHRGERAGYCNFILHPWDEWVAVVGVILAVPELRGRGIGTEVHRLLVSEVFNAHPGVEKIEAVTDVENAAERRVLEKNGFKREGVLRWRNLLRGELRDMCFYGKLRPEWEREE